MASSTLFRKLLASPMACSVAIAPRVSCSQHSSCCRRMPSPRKKKFEKPLLAIPAAAPDTSTSSRPFSLLAGTQREAEMAIKFSGEFEVKKSQDEVFAFLTDPNKFAALLPDFQSLAVQDATHFTIKVNVGISYIKGTADLKMELAEADRPHRAQYKGQGGVAGGNVTLVASFDLKPSTTNNNGTKVIWQGEA